MTTKQTLSLGAYNCALALALPLLPAYLLYRRWAKGKPSSHLKERLGLNPPAPAKGGRPIWIHAVSVGEVLTVRPLVDEILARQPGSPVYLSVTTAAGRAAAEKAYGGRVAVFQFPFDFPWATSRIFERLDPSCVVVAETEVWPNMLWNANCRGTPVWVVNGRISDRAFPKYRRVRQVLRPVMELVHFVLAQSETDARRFVELGVPVDRVRVTGNMKFDCIRLTPSAPVLTAAIRAAFGSPAPLLLVAGSTMEGEEAALAGIVLRLKEACPRLGLVVAPRHPERFSAVAEMFGARGLKTLCRTELGRGPVRGDADVVVLDTVGELAAVFSVADVVFIGGTLAPHGGHNVLEPAAAGRPVVVGPSMENFRDVCRLFLDRNAMVQVQEAGGLEAAIGRLLGDPEERVSLGNRALALVRENQGASLRNYEMIFSEVPRP